MKNTIIPSVIISLTIFYSCSEDSLLNQDCNHFNESISLHLKNDPNKIIDYVIPCVISAPKDIVIDAGTVIEFEQGAGIDIPEGGSIKAIGTSEAPILLTSKTKQKGTWKGIRIQSSNVLNQLEYLTIEYAGEGNYDSNEDKGAIILSHNSKANIINCVVQHNTNAGINIITETNSTLQNCVFKDNEYPVRIDPRSLNILGNQNQFIDNIHNQIWVDLKMVTILQETTLSKLEIPYYFKYNGGSFDIKSNVKIEPGVVIIMSPGAAINIDGNGASFYAVGTATEPIIIKGEIEQAGAWKNIYFQFTSNILNQIAYAKIMHGGENINETKGVIELWADPSVKIENTEFYQNQGCDIMSHTQSPMNLTYTNITNNSNAVTPCEP